MSTDVALMTALAQVCAYHQDTDGGCEHCAETLYWRRERWGWTDEQITADAELFRTDPREHYYRMLIRDWRVQRRRTAGWTMPEGAVYVGRPSTFGNPFIPATIITQGQAANATQARTVAVDLHRQWLGGYGEDVITVGATRYNRREVLATIHHLRGKRLACWCPKPADPREVDHCHAGTLIRLVNRVVEWPA